MSLPSGGVHSKQKAKFILAQSKQKGNIFLLETAGMNELIFLFRAAVGGFAMDPVIAMRRATMMDDDMHKSDFLIDANMRRPLAEEIPEGHIITMSQPNQKLLSSGFTHSVTSS